MRFDQCLTPRAFCPWLEYETFLCADTSLPLVVCVWSSDPAYLKNKGDQLRILMLLVLTQPKLEPSVLKELVSKSKIGDAGKVWMCQLLVALMMSYSSLTGRCCSFSSLSSLCAEHDPKLEKPSCAGGFAQEHHR
jgi:hypothetical protein